MNSPEEQRLDKWLWYARIVKSRSLAAKLIEAGCIRVNRQRVVKAAATVRCGDVLTATLHGRVRVIEIRGLSERRGPASEAQMLYAELLQPLLHRQKNERKNQAKAFSMELGRRPPGDSAAAVHNYDAARNPDSFRPHYDGAALRERSLAYG